MARPIVKTPIERFEEKYIPEPNSGCWLWTAALTSKGYGAFAVGVKTREAYRFSYEFYRGKVPKEKELDHLCRVRCCVNPEHLEAVTTKENILRSPFTWGGRAIRKTHCPQGHAYTKDNTYDVAGKRACKICGAAYDKKRGWRRGIQAQ